MSQLENDIQEIQVTISDLQEVVKKREAFLRLKDNKDFKTIIENGYFEEEAVRLVKLRSESGYESPEVQERLLKEIDAIGAFFQYLKGINLLGLQAERELARNKETLNELEQESAKLEEV
jgi:GTP cyclohydrolase III